MHARRSVWVFRLRMTERGLLKHQSVDSPPEDYISIYDGITEGNPIRGVISLIGNMSQGKCERIECDRGGTVESMGESSCTEPRHLIIRGKC